MLLSLVTSASSCSAGDSGASSANTIPTGGAQSSPGVIALPAVPYRVRPVANGGSITGHVLIAGAVPGDAGMVASRDSGMAASRDSGMAASRDSGMAAARDSGMVAARDSGMAAARDRAMCGAMVADSSLPHRGDSLGNVVVWVRDVREGRALPVERRLQLVHERCVLTPRVQAAVTGSTVNVLNQDAMVFRMTAERDGRRDTLAIFRMSDAGQVVPSEKLAGHPGLVKLACDQSPQARGWIAVFDHPYFAVTGADGAFRIDSLPPGRYHLKAWHERATKIVEREVEVRGGTEKAVEMRMVVR